jgi:hypothetical protein
MGFLDTVFYAVFGEEERDVETQLFWAFGVSLGAGGANIRRSALQDLSLGRLGWMAGWMSTLISMGQRWKQR